MKSFVASIGDRHMSYIERKKLSQSSQKTYVAHNTIQMKEGVAYVHLASPQSSAGQLQKSIEETASAIRALHEQGAKFWIIDLRDHAGGSLFAYLDMIYPLLPQSRASGTRDHNELEIYNWITEKGVGVGNQEKLLKLRSGYGASVSNPIPVDIPLAILINKNTASSGEFVALVLRERPNTKIFGEQSDGLLSANAPQTLLNGDILVLPTAQAINNEGVFQYSVKPDEQVESALAFRRAVEWLKSLE